MISPIPRSTKRVQFCLPQALNGKPKTNPEILPVIPHGFNRLQFTKIRDAEIITEEELKLRAKEAAVETSRETKWNYMLQNWPDIHRKKIDERVKKGIPDSVRELAWTMILDPDSQNETQFRQRQPLNTFTTRDIYGVETSVQHIARYIAFIERVRPSVVRLILGYASVERKFHFVQEMAFIPALLLTYMDEEHAFWCFRTVMKDPRIDHWTLFTDEGIDRVMRLWSTVLTDEYPKVAQKLKQFEIYKRSYALKWFQTAFIDQQFSPIVRLRVFDRFLRFGLRALLSFGLVIISRHKDIFSRAPGEDILTLLNEPGRTTQMSNWRYVLRKYEKLWISRKRYIALQKRINL